MFFFRPVFFGNPQKHKTKRGYEPCAAKDFRLTKTNEHMKQKRFTILIALLCLVGHALAQNRPISGRVTSAGDGSPLAGVSVMLQGTNAGTQTDGNGNYSITAPAEARLSFRYVGYASQAVAVGDRLVIDVQLEELDNTLDQVVVTGGGLVASRRAVGAAQTTIKADDLQKAKPTNVVTGLTGKVAGLIVQGVGSGPNPEYRVMLRGMRSLTGNNQALIVIDNVISPNAMLGNLNPDDIEDITVLNGASAAVIYGSQASNGALIIKTKQGSSSEESMEITLEHTTTMEEISFLPGVQKRFGAGAEAHFPIYMSHENQQYGPAFDGSIVLVGDPLEDGSEQRLPYAWSGHKDDFWETGVANQTNLSVGSKSENSQFRLSSQYLGSTGTIPFDKFNRATARISGTRKMHDMLEASYTLSYVQNRYDQTPPATRGTIYDNVLQSPGNVPLLDYKDWRNNPFANPNGYYNGYYNNPYFIAENNRQYVRNDYLTGGVQLDFNPLKWLDFTGRVGMTTQNQSTKATVGKFTYTPYAGLLHGAYKLNNIVGSVSDNFGYTTNLASDFIAHAKHKEGNFTFDYTALFQFMQNERSGLRASVEGLVVDDLYNLGNSLNTPAAGQDSYKARTFGLAGKVDLAYKNYLFLSLFGRNDWVSILEPSNRSFFYPGATLSFAVSDAVENLKDWQPLDFLKLRASWASVGQVNVGNFLNFGAYSLDPVFVQGAGYPYDGKGGFTLGDQVVQKGLKPEITRGYELGFESAWWENRITTDFTYFDTRTTDNTVPARISWATGYSNYLLNAGTTTGRGIESRLTLVPIRTDDWELRTAGNFTYLRNRVEEIAEGQLEELALGGYGSGAGSYAAKGEAFPIIKGYGYNRDPQGRIIVDRITGYPSRTEELINLGAALPTHTLGLNLTLSYKDLSFYASGEYRTGNYIYNSGGGSFDFSGSGINTVAYDRERFVIPNSSYWDPDSQTYVANTNITVYDGGADYWTIGGPRTDIHETYVTSAAFWKIREMSLTYNLPRALLGRQKTIKKARISAQGRNLFLWTPATNVYTDPEYSDGNGLANGNALGLTALRQTPPSRYMGASLFLTF